ncbi:MAG: tetratricopeptide repeat protein [Candidatus Nanopelagicales bacterium]|jgi:tetratricopeptide (TPR) repeat protein|nr:tetratricopeptide repeat protein [Candidatus Nanopelagicales bacterium]
MPATVTPGPAGGPPDPDDRYTLARGLVAAQRWAAALDAVAAGLAAAPDDPVLLGLQVRALRALGRSAQALPVAQRLWTLAPEDPYPCRLLTLVLLDLGQVDAALQAAGRAVCLDPQNGANHLALSRAWADSSRPGAVERQLASARIALQLDPSSIDAQLQLGTALAASGEVAAARAAYREVLRLEPGNAAALNNLAVLDLQAGAHRAAARTLAAALAADPQDRDAQRNLDVVAVWAVRRVGWVLLAGPLPAMLAAALGWALVGRLLAAAVLLGGPLAATRWWRGLTEGQRHHLRTLPRRIPPARWLRWPVAAALVGGAGLALVLLAPRLVAGPAGAIWALAALALALARVLAATLRRSRRAEVAGRWDRVRHR